MMDVDFQLAQQMQTEEQEQLSIEEKSKLFVELLEKRKKHFAALRAQEKRSNPPTKTQKINTMSTYLKKAGYKHNQLKNKSYDEIQEMFNKEMKKVNTFIDMNTELVKGSKTKAEGSSKRAGDELEQEKAKKQKGNDDQEEEEMKKQMEIVQDDEVAIDAIPIATKPPVIVEWKIIKEEKIGYFKLIRADGSLKRIQKININFRGELLGLKDFKMILRVTTAQLQLLSNYNCKLRGRLLKSTQEDAKYEHVGQDTRS
ncbi:hypothetical protein Tco_0895480 [Tanacetum coccineum]|uniref:Uncharacterized protein n=1 Tax=Tanacetum coccineum TaxID=301880 RepID=A0ABQ5CHY5_9ASTR